MSLAPSRKLGRAFGNVGTRLPAPEIFGINGSGKACCVAAAGKLSALGPDLGEG
jgi:hypothetical protein